MWRNLCPCLVELSLSSQAGRAATRQVLHGTFMGQQSSLTTRVQPVGRQVVQGTDFVLRDRKRHTLCLPAPSGVSPLSSSTVISPVVSPAASHSDCLVAPFFPVSSFHVFASPCFVPFFNFSSSGCRRRDRGTPAKGREVGGSRTLISHSSLSPASSPVISFLGGERRDVEEGGVLRPLSSPLEDSRKMRRHDSGQQENSQRRGDSEKFRLRIASIASASLLFAFAFRQWAEGQEEKRRNVWWKESSRFSPSSSSPSSPSLSPSSPHLSPSSSSLSFLSPLSSSVSAPYGRPPLPASYPHAFRLPSEVASREDLVSGPDREKELSGGPASAVEAPLPPPSLSSPVSKLALALASDVSPLLPSSSSGEDVEAFLSPLSEAEIRRETARQMLLGKPLTVKGMGDVTPGSRVIVHDCRPLRENASLVFDFLRAADSAFLSTSGDAKAEKEIGDKGECEEDPELQEALAALYDSEIELWESAAFRQIVEAWREELYRRSAVGDVLEVGVGRARGLWNPGWKQWCSSYTGVDVRLHDEARRTVEMLSSPSHRSGPALPLLDLLESDAHDLPFPGSSFDSVLSHRVLCCVKSPATVVSSLLRVLRPGGILLLFEHGGLHPAVERALATGCSDTKEGETRGKNTRKGMTGEETRAGMGNALGDTRGRLSEERLEKTQESAERRHRKQVGRTRKEGRRRRQTDFEREREVEGCSEGATAEEAKAEGERNGSKQGTVDWEKLFPLPPEELEEAVAALQMPTSFSGRQKRTGDSEWASGESEAEASKTGTCAWIDVLGETIQIAHKQERGEGDNATSPSRERRTNETTSLPEGLQASWTEGKESASGAVYGDPFRSSVSSDAKTPIIEEVHIFVSPRPEIERSWTCLRCVAAGP
ncbi:methyltransferase domain-containing protein [Toxoplasma gondii ME49]|uniref:Methyltransferase domain-containing protein n=4 Tax=Toxoplasma gondii TaxID=5811 RepID=A0A125YNW4_TOXGV|nr:methyltransferase domain-containing protein [Toxoplasma gondii ME49]EPT24946.1 methyltransferase domain-containing protein [Toxoplasma gondii ME49]ESS34348.1 methyltransferase domain-containing protein [Toxoplasma gondii VEG]KFG46753.1 methyltransferase domain-containing protein [Toxoplasma gondii GAB2-2007-GAL-DOM2]|eukprot:XP_002367126.2 methyltransferase domain-containing protein [Toxoplasma gondii ME49]